MKPVFFALTLFAAIAVAFVAGLWVGAPAFQMGDAQYRASIIAYQLRMIEQQQISELKQALEIELNSRLADHGRFLSSPIPTALLRLPSVNSSAIQNAAQYRKSHPFLEPNLSSAASWSPGIDMNTAVVRDEITGQKENQRLIESVLERYVK
jgi:hypothetical protein